jgi:polyphosphate kinase 2 (PPK2 family)
MSTRAKAKQDARDAGRRGREGERARARHERRRLERRPVEQGLRQGAEEAARRARQAAALGRAHGAKVCIVFEGRDGAGKGGTIKAITERVSPRVFRVVALPAPTEREKSQMYIQRYLPHLPAAARS